MGTDELKEVFAQRWDEDQLEQNIPWDGDEPKEREAA